MPTEINSKLVLVSQNKMTGVVLYTFLWTYPRIILPEVNTYRMFSRNTASSRAVPIEKMIDRAVKDPFIPVKWGKNQKGMQAFEEVDAYTRSAAISEWLEARNDASRHARNLSALGIHKQIVNRLLEPWLWTWQLVTTTNIKNMLMQRTDEMAEPHFQILAKQVRQQVQAVHSLLVTGMSWMGVDTPQGSYGAHVQRLGLGEWHLPFIDESDHRDAEAHSGLMIDVLKKISAARCARTSYNIPETGQRSTIERDLELYERLAGSEPRHLSPFEHQATPIDRGYYVGNFRSWVQYRKEFANEDGGDRN